MFDNLGGFIPKAPGDFNRGEFAGFSAIVLGILGIFYFTGIMPVALVPFILTSLFALTVGWTVLALHQWSRQHAEQSALPTPSNRAVLMIEELRDRASSIDHHIGHLFEQLEARASEPEDSEASWSLAQEIDACADFQSQLNIAANRTQRSFNRYSKGLLTADQLTDRVDAQFELLERPLPRREPKRVSDLFRPTALGQAPEALPQLSEVVDHQAEVEQDGLPS